MPEGLNKIDPVELEKIMSRTKGTFYWRDLCCTYEIPEFLLRKFSSKLDWKYISKTQKLSISFMQDFKDRIDWYELSWCAELDSSTVDLFSSELQWDFICYKQKLDLRTVQKHEEHISWVNLSLNKRTSKKIRYYYSDKLINSRIKTGQKNPKEVI